jgi:hypothetical protein
VRHVDPSLRVLDADRALGPVLDGEREQLSPPGADVDQDLTSPGRNRDIASTP